jgi:hypothetical protein
MDLPNLALLPALAIVAGRKITVRPILNAEEKKGIFLKMRLNGLSAKLERDPATARAKGKAKAKAKAKQEEIAIGKGKATAGNHLAQIGRKGMDTANGQTIVASPMMDLKGEKENQHLWQLRVLQRNKRNR